MKFKYGSLIACGVLCIAMIFGVWIIKQQGAGDRGQVVGVQEKTSRNALAIVMEIRGSAILERKGIKTPVLSQMQLQEGDLLSTNPTSTVILLWTNTGRSILSGGTTLALRELSQRKNDSAFRIRLQLEAGRIWTRLQRILGPESSFSVRAQTVVATVRGTSFGVSLTNATSVNVQVMESTVAVARVRDEGAAEKMIGSPVIVGPQESIRASVREILPLPVPAPLTAEELRDSLLLEGHATISESFLQNVQTAPSPAVEQPAPLSPQEQRPGFQPPSSEPTRTTPSAPLPVSAPASSPAVERALPQAPPKPAPAAQVPSSPLPAQPSTPPTQSAPNPTLRPADELNIENFLERTATPAEPAALIPQPSPIR